MIRPDPIQRYVRNPILRNWLEVLAAFAIMRLSIVIMGWIFVLPAIQQFLRGHDERFPIMLLVMMLPSIFLGLSIGSGWWGLSLSFKTDRPLPANRRLGSASFRYVVGYNNVLRLGSDAEGLYIACWVPLFHPPLFIPWTEIEVGKEKRIIFRYRTLKLGIANRVPFGIDGKTADRLLLGRDEPAIEPPGGLTYATPERGFWRRLFP